MKNKNIRIKKTIFIVGIAILCALYIRFAWARYEEKASDEAIMLAQSLETMFHTEHIKELKGNIEDLENPEYLMAKENLIRLANTANSYSLCLLFRSTRWQDCNPHRFRRTI